MHDPIPPGHGEPEPSGFGRGSNTYTDEEWDAVLDAADIERKRRREAGIPNPYLPKTEPAETRCGETFGMGVVCVLPAAHDGGHYFRSIPAREENAA